MAWASIATPRVPLAASTAAWVSSVGPMTCTVCTFSSVTASASTDTTRSACGTLAPRLARTIASAAAYLMRLSLLASAATSELSPTESMISASASASIAPMATGARPFRTPASSALRSASTPVASAAIFSSAATGPSSAVVSSPFWIDVSIRWACARLACATALRASRLFGWMRAASAATDLASSVGYSSEGTSVATSRSSTSVHTTSL